jgi:GcrA cell cycle regulator
MPPNHVNAIWTDEQSALLKANLVEGLSMAENAAEINEKFNTHYSRNAVCGRAYRIGLIAPEKPKPPPQPRKHQPYKPRPKRFNAEYQQQQLRCEEIRPDHVSMVDLSENGCRWPYGDQGYTFCNQRQTSVLRNGEEIEVSYCEPHYRLSVRT